MTPETTRSAMARFFLRVGQSGTADLKRDRETLPLFPLVLILDADGTLSDDAKHLVGGIDNSGWAP